MALSLLVTASDGGTIEAGTWNAEFNNIYNNSLSLISPLTGTLNLDGQTLWGGAVISGDLTFSDGVNATFGTGGDADIRWSTGDSSNHSLVIALGANQGLHVTDLGAVATDWNIAATTHPNLYLHSNTTPATDYLRLGDHDGTSAYVDVVGGSTLNFGIAGTTNMALINKILFLGDTANANMTVGLTINQAANDDYALVLKSSDVAHGVTSVSPGPSNTETDDYFTIQKATAATGGVLITALEESGGTLAFLVDVVGGAPPTTDSTSSHGQITFRAAQHNGSNALTTMASNSNLFVIMAQTTTRLLLKSDDGELHLGNTTLVALDDEDDIMGVRGLQKFISGGKGIKETPWDTSDYGIPPFSYEKLHKLGILGPLDENGEGLFAVQPRFAMNEGAIWQTYCKLMETKQRCDVLEQRLLALEGPNA